MNLLLLVPFTFFKYIPGGHDMEPHDFEKGIMKINFFFTCLLFTILFIKPHMKKLQFFEKKINTSSKG